MTARLLAAAASARPDVPLPDVPLPDPPEGPAGDFDLGGWRAGSVERSIARLVDAGLVEDGTNLTVPPSLRPALAAALEHLDSIIAETDG